MKKINATLLLAGLLLATIGAKAQDDVLEVRTGGTFGKSKIVPSMEKLAVAQASIYFKNATTREFAKNERNGFGGRKSGGQSISGRLTAYLETTDGDLTQQDYQQLADGFWTYLNKKLNSAGIATVDWKTISGTDFYKSQEDNDKGDGDNEETKGQIYMRANANNGNTLFRFKPYGNINPGFAFGKAKKAANFSGDVDAPVVFMHVVVDFADIILDGDVHSGEHYSSAGVGLTKITKTANFSFNADAGPNMKVAGNLGTAYFYNHKNQQENMYVIKDISSKTAYADKVSQDPEKAILRKPIFYFGKDFKATPVVMETTREKYKNAAAKALEAYADAFVALIQKSKKD